MDNVERLNVRPVAPRPVEAPPSQPVISEAIQELLHDHAQKLLTAAGQVAHQRAVEAVQQSDRHSYNTLTATFKAISTILAVRFILLLAVVGGFSLAVMVLSNPSTVGAAILGGYVVSTIWPLVWLDGSTKRKVADGNA